MLVYGDVETAGTVGGKIAVIAETLHRTARTVPGLARHASLVRAFIEAGELAQGLIDAEFHEQGYDADTPLHRSAMALLHDFAHAVVRSWLSGFADQKVDPSLVDRLAVADSGQSLRTKSAEGYAFYALYPESYAEAAHRSGLGSRTQVIGIRSIGTGLSAIVAAALGAPTPFTVRPVGHPFQREVQVDPVVTRALTADQNATFAIVDEGPGLSGSSFGAIADWLEGAGIAPERIHFFPSHGGPLGPQAGERHRIRWHHASRHIVSVQDLLFGHDRSHRVESWVETLVGPLEAPLDDLSGGVWRQRRYRSEGEWPAANTQQERLKFLAHAQGRSWLMKFAGIGGRGEEKAARARDLHRAGFTPQPVGFCHGFTVERWHEDARPLDPASFDRQDLVGSVGPYLGFRASRFASTPDQGASLDALRHMACHNVAQALGEGLSHEVARRLHQAERLQAQVRVVDTDNRMHVPEWLVVDGRLLKADALDHSRAHDLIGHQDIAWDVIGAAIELALNEEELSRLCAIVAETCGCTVDPDLLSFYRPCYLAFQMGSCLIAVDAVGDGPEAQRLRRAGEHYGTLLRQMLA